MTRLRLVPIPADKVRHLLPDLERLISEYPDATPFQLQSMLGGEPMLSRVIRGLQVLSEEMPGTKSAVEAVFSRTSSRDLVFRFEEYDD